MEQEVLIKFIEHRASMAEQQAVLEWIESNPENRMEFARLKNLAVAVDLMTEQKYAEKRFGRRRVIGGYIIRCAQIAAILVFGAALFYGGNYMAHKKFEKIAALEFTEVTAPLGDIVPITLPDGSKVILNSGTTIKFSKLFNTKERTVYLSGEGYFDVEKGETRFNVLYPMEDPIFKVSVLGTKFNVFSYNDEAELVTSLYEGSVEIEGIRDGRNVKLHPNQKFRYSKVSNESFVENIKETYRWTDEYVVADGEDIVSFAKRLEKIFNVTIIIDEELKGNFSYKGALYGGSLKQILDNMTYVSPIKYSINTVDKTVTIEKNK